MTAGKRFRAILAVVAVIGSAALCGLAAFAREPDEQSFDMIARGRYLTQVGDCTACHTEPGGKPFAGGRPIQTPFGNILAPNITPDQDTGIGSWSEAQFYDTMHRGHADHLLYPAMPYPYYTKATRSDIDAIRAYLQTVEPVTHEVHADILPFPFNIRLSMHFWNWLYFTPGTWTGRADKSAEWNRGGYLVEGLGHCGACHTPKTWLGGDNNGNHMGGYALQGWFAPNITGNNYDGLGRWSVDDIVEYLKTGVNRFGTASGPMAEEVADSTQHWTLSDLRAAATYLKDQAGTKVTPPQPIAANDPVMQAGADIYSAQCAACHAMSGEGIQRMFPTLKGSPAVQSASPMSLLHVVLEGTRAVQTEHAPTAPAMPAFEWKLTDAQVAAVTTYVRNSWGNAGSAVTSGDVSDARKSLQTGGS